MKNYIIIALLITLGALAYLVVKDTSKNSGKAPTIEEQILSSSEILTPDDLNIKKHVMHAQHADDEVVVLRSVQEFDGKLIKEMISYHRAINNKIISIPIVELNKSYLALMSNGNKSKGTPDFCDNILIWCGGFSIEFDHLYFSGSNSSNSSLKLRAGKRIISQNKNKTVIRFNEQWQGKGRELKLTFTLEPMLYSDALKACPKLNPIEKNKGWTYQDIKHGSQDAHRAWFDSVKRGNDGTLYKEQTESKKTDSSAE